MKLEKVMKTDVECVKTFENVFSAAERMKARNIGFLPVCDESGAVVGTVTDRDLAIRVLGERRNPESCLVGEVMTGGPITCTTDDDVHTVEELMAEAHVSRIVCVDDDRCPIGVISLSDIAQEEKGGRAAAILREVSAREARPSEA